MIIVKKYALCHICFNMFRQTSPSRVKLPSLSTFSSRGRCECPLRALPAWSTVGRHPHGALRCGCSFISSGRAVPAGLCIVPCCRLKLFLHAIDARDWKFEIYMLRNMWIHVLHSDFYQFWWRCVFVLQQLFNRTLFFQGMFCVGIPLIQVRYQMISMSLTVCTTWWHFCLI